MSTFHRYVRLVALGWGITAAFGLFVVFAADEPGAGMVLTVVSVVMGAWLLARPGRAGLVVSLVLGLLHALEQAGYSAADVGNGEGGTLVGDQFGLVGAVVIVVGAVLALRARVRESRPVVPAAG